MRRPVREIDAFYEARGNYIVDKRRATEIYNASAELVSQCTGPIALKGVRGVNIPMPGNILDIDRLRLSNENHTALLTARTIKDENDLGEHFSTGGISQVRQFKDGSLGSAMAVQVFPERWDSNESMGIYVATHELVHTFGLLEHCVGSMCVMQACANNDTSYAERVLQDPFCDNCACDLEVAGYQLRAEQL
jgi:hypothetical protein